MTISTRDTFRDLGDRERYLQDTVAFDTEILGLDVEPFHLEADRTLEKHRNVLWNAPVGHGKSTKFGFARAVHEICRDRDIRIILGSKSLPRARDLLRRIRTELEHNERLISLFGPFRDPKMWSGEQFQVLGREKNQKEPTVTATGLHGAVEGVRGDLGILDDVIDIKSMTSQLEREEAKRWLDNTLIPRLEPEARCWVVGTRWHPEDLYDHILKKPGWEPLVHKAILDEEKKEVLWPGRWSWDRLMELKEDLGTLVFEARLMNNPQAIEGVVFKSEWLRHVEDVPKNLTTYQGWDLAISEKETADYTVCITLGVDPKDHSVYLMDCFRERLDFPAQTKAIEDQAAIYKPKTVAVESNAYQRAAAQHVRRSSMLPVLESPAKGDKVSRIQGISPHFESGRIRLWREMRGLSVFVSEFVNFPFGTHDDTLDALWHALQQAIKHKKWGVAKW
jgi:predicted phage terminase large subunit-like protein